MLGTSSLLRPDLSGRRTRLALAAAVLGGLAVALIYTIGTGDVRLTIMVAGIGIAPALLVLALRRSYLFPYGLYVVLVPFDNMLKISGSGTLTKMLGIASAIFIAIYAFRRKGLSRPTPTLYLWLGYALWTLISMMWAPDLGNATIDVEQTVSIIGLFAVLALAPVEERDVRAICACIVFGGIAASIYGMYLLHDAPPQLSGDFGRLMINVGNRTIDPNHFANSMLGPFALALVGVLNARKPGTLIFSLVAAVLMVAGILMSLSREALLACVIIIVVTVWFSRRRIVGLLIASGLMIGIPLLVPSIGTRMADALVTGGAGRTSIWSVGLLAWKAHPWFGWGAGGAIDAYDRNYLAIFQVYNAGWGRPPHNTPLHCLVELGVVGLVLLAGAYLLTFENFRFIRRGDSLYDMRVALTAGALALGFTSLFIDEMNYKYVWIVLATIAQLRNVARQRREPLVVYEPPPLQRRFQPRTLPART